MSKFVIACPVCNRYAEGKTGFFATRRIHCACGNTIHVKTDKLTSRECPSCGNNVLYDQTEGKNAKCPVCQAQLVSDESMKNLVHFRCDTCGCSLQADKSAHLLTCPVCDNQLEVQLKVKLRLKNAQFVHTLKPILK